jgi:hypothetical protein
VAGRQTGARPCVGIRSRSSATVSHGPAALLPRKHPIEGRRPEEPATAGTRPPFTSRVNISKKRVRHE